MYKIFDWLIQPPTNGPRSTLFLRLMAGGVFFWEGLLKFVYTNQGIGRFAKLGIPYPHFTANFVGGLEIVGGLLLLSGLATRLIRAVGAGIRARGEIPFLHAVATNPAIGLYEKLGFRHRRATVFAAARVPEAQSRQAG